MGIESFSSPPQPDEENNGAKEIRPPEQLIQSIPKAVHEADLSAGDGTDVMQLEDSPLNPPPEKLDKGLGFQVESGLVAHPHEQPQSGGNAWPPPSV